MADLDVLRQLIDSMQDAVEKLETAIGRNNIEESRKIKLFILDLHKKINRELSG